MKLGITQLTSGCGGMDMLQKAAELKIQGVEPMIGLPDQDYLCWTEEQYVDFKKYAKHLQIEIPSVAMGLFCGDSSLIQADRAAEAISLIQQSLNFTAKLNANIMLLCTFYASNPDNETKVNNLRNVLNDVEPIAKKLGITIALESPMPAHQLSQFVDNFHSDFIAVYYDLGNAIFLSQNPADEIVTLGQRIKAVHVKDTKNELGDSNLGKGRLELGKAMKSLNHTGFNQWLFLETPRNFDQQALNDDIELMRQYCQNQ